MFEKPSLLERLTQSERPLLGDGAMGTLLHERGHIAIDACFDALNLEQPELVLGVHRDYLAAGSDLIETNTFGANRFKLGEHGLSERMEAINAAGVKLAQQARVTSGREDAYIVGSIGPLGVKIRPYGAVTQDEARDAFRAQLRALVDHGVEGLLLESFGNHDELLLAVSVAREVAPDLPIIAQATFNPDGVTQTGSLPARVASDLSTSGADVIGVNCGVGPAKLSQFLDTMMHAVPEARYSVWANAGYPEVVQGRAMYAATPEYFGDYALTFRGMGAGIIGGCCGTKPEHIAAMRASLDDPTPSETHLHIADQHDEADEAVNLAPTHLAQRLAEGDFVVTVELTPPRSFNAQKMLRHARLLRDAGADFLDVADYPAAKMKMSAWAAAHLLQTEVGMETVLHFPTRGRNLLRVQGDLLAAHALDQRNLFVTMGDPTHIGDYPDAMDAYDIVPSKLIDLIAHHMNEGRDMAGNSIGQATRFTVGCALNMAADDLDREIKVLRKKLEAGAAFALGQAVFDPPRVERFHQRYRELTGEAFKLPVLLGLIPLYSVRHARFLHNEVPGITIPDAIFQRLEAAGEAAPREGVAIAHELMNAMRDQVQGAYIIPSYGRYEIAAQLVNAIVREVAPV